MIFAVPLNRSNRSSTSLNIFTFSQLNPTTYWKMPISHYGLLEENYANKRKINP